MTLLSSVVSNSLLPHGMQHARPPCPSPTPGVYSDTWPLSRWCHPTISSSAVPFSCFQLFPASGSFPMSQFFTSGGQSIGASASVFPMNLHGWFPLRLTGLISLLSKGLSGVLSSTSLKVSILWHSTSQSYVTTGKTIAWTIWTFVGRVMSLLFSTLSRFFLAFL